MKWILIFIFSFKKIPNTIPVCANDAAKISGLIMSNPVVETLLIMMATSPQCRPKMTKICQKAPNKIPANTGLKL